MKYKFEVKSFCSNVWVGIWFLFTKIQLFVSLFCHIVSNAIFFIINILENVNWKKKHFHLPLIRKKEKQRNELLFRMSTSTLNGNKQKKIWREILSKLFQFPNDFKTTKILYIFLPLVWSAFISMFTELLLLFITNIAMR